MCIAANWLMALYVISFAMLMIITLSLQLAKAERSTAARTIGTVCIDAEYEEVNTWQE